MGQGPCLVKDILGVIGKAIFLHVYFIHTLQECLFNLSRMFGFTACLNYQKHPHSLTHAPTHMLCIHSVIYIYLPHPCRETSISDITLTQTSSTVATLSGLGLTVVGVVVGRGCIRACHRPIIERYVVRSIGIVHLYTESESK